MHDPGFFQYLTNLKEKETDKFMDICYASLSSDFNISKNDKNPIELKNEAIHNLIKHFESKEQYEKCSKLQELLNYLK